jgi:hypothetical protein
MQCHVNDVTVNDVPKFLTHFPTDNTHALVVQNPDDDLTTLSFPLHLQGVTLYLLVCKPTADKWESGDIVRIDMTAENLDWNPNDPTYSSQEAAMIDYRGVVLPRPDRGQPFVINALSSMTIDAADITNDENFGIAVDQHVTVSVAALDTTKTAPGWIHSKAGKPVDAEMLAKRVVQNPDNDSTTLSFPLHLQGVMSYLPVRKPTADKWESGDIVRIDMTAENLDWNPNDPTYSSQEAAMTDYRGVVLPRPDKGQPFVINTLSSMTIDAADITNDENFGIALDQHVTVSVAALDTTKTAPGWIHSKAGKLVDAEMLAKCWLIPANCAARTVDRTTQQGVCTMLNPTLSCRFPTNDCMLHYPRMPHPVFGNTMLAGTESKNGNKCCQVFAINFGWARAHPLKRKGEAHEALSLMFKRDSVPPEMILDGSKEQVKGAFKHKLKEVNCHLRVTEPYSPWQQAAEGCIRKLKRGVSRKMIKTGAPKRLWGHCIELEGLIRSHTANDIYATGGEVPETIMKGRTADINQICEFVWYDWVMFRDTVNTITFPNKRLTLGRYLGPAIDIGLALTAKILKQNSQYVCRLTLCHLTPEETLCTVQIAVRLHFDNMIVEHIGPKSVPGDFPTEDLTPEYEHYHGHIIAEDTENA